ncbi:MAG: dehydrogenase [Frankiales bacterium]|nr:dehydrogenase [Frankiales bacterium]
MLDAVVVGAGINGLTAAATLARAGLSVHVYEQAPTIGGGCRSAELTGDGLVHDVCASVVPLAAASPFLRELGLDALGVELVWPDVQFAHPIDARRAALVHRSVERTAASLGADGASYRAMVEQFLPRIDKLTDFVTGPLLRWPGDVPTAVRFGAQAILSADLLTRRFGTEEAKAILVGCAAHSTARPRAAVTGGFALFLALLAHSAGWPFVVGGTQRLTDGLGHYIASRGGEIVTGHPVGRLEDLPPARAVILDLMPEAVLRLAGRHLPATYRWQLRRWRHGPGVCKVDFSLSEPVPWLNADLARAGTLHLGGTAADIARSEDAVSNGRHADRPFVIAAQATLTDATRAPRGGHTLWTYCHVPNGSSVDMSERIIAEVERYAPNFRDVVRRTHVRTSVDYQAYNPNFVGGDITGGAPTLLQTAVRPALSFPPYRTPLKGVYLCSSATPPGAGVHGMSGHRAALSALRHEFRD